MAYLLDFDAIKKNEINLTSAIVAQILTKENMSNTYGTNTGERFTTSQIDNKIRKAKIQKIGEMLDEYGYVKCEECGVNASNTYIDCSHDVSVKEAKETGQTQLCWDVGNITLLCRKHHQIKDGLYLGNK